jgi:hypothetical protein
MHGKTADILFPKFNFASMYSCPDLETQPPGFVAER